MGPCHSSNKSKNASKIKKPSPPPALLNENLPNSLIKLKTVQSRIIEEREEKANKEQNVEKNEKSKSIISENLDKEESLTHPLDKTFEIQPLKKKVVLKKSGLKVAEDKTKWILELTFSYKEACEFTILFPLESEQTRYQWELQGFQEGYKGYATIYKVCDKKTDLKANLQIIEFESEDEPQIAEISYQIFIIQKLKEALQWILEEEEQIPRKKKDNDARDFLHDPPFLQIFDYYIVQEGSDKSLRPKKWLHVVWEYWDTTLNRIIESRIMEKKIYLDESLAYIGKCFLYVLEILKRAKIAHRNFKPQNVFYVASSKKYKLGNFFYAKFINLHKIIMEEEKTLNKSPTKQTSKELSTKRSTKRQDFLSKRFSVKTIDDRNLIEFNKFDHSVIGTPDYMDPVLKEAFLENKETVRLLDGLLYSDLFAFAMSMFELENLEKKRDLQKLLEDAYSTAKEVYSMKTVLLKILNVNLKIEEMAKKSTKRKSTLSGMRTLNSPTKTENSNSPERESFARVRNKKGFLKAGQFFVDNYQDKGVRILNEYQKFSKTNIQMLIGYMKKVSYFPPDESDFISDYIDEILESEGPLAKQKLMIRFYCEIGEYQNALDELTNIKETLENEHLLIESDLDMAFFNYETARIYMILGKYTASLTTLEKVRSLLNSMEIRDKVIDLRKKALMLRMLIYKNKGDYKLAIKAAKKTIGFIEKTDKSASLYELAMTQEFIAELFFLLDDNNEAMAYIQMGLAYYREIELTRYTSLQLADALIFASQIYKSLLEEENSEAFLTEANVIYSNKYGENHPVIGYISLQMSIIYRDKANYMKAMMYGEKCLKILREYHALEDDNVVAATKNLSLIYKEAEDINKSIKLLKDFIDNIDKNKMLDDPCAIADIMYNLGLCYFETNDYPNARKLLTESLAIYNSNLVEDDLILNDILQKLTMVSYEMTKNNSKSTLEHTLYPKKSSFQQYEEGHLVNSYINLADILMMRSEFERSLKLYLLALKIKKNTNYNDSKMNDILMKVGLINLIAGKYEESLKYFQECLKFILDISANQMTEHIMRLNLIISHLHLILDQKSLAQDHNEKAGKILKHLRSASKTQFLDPILASQTQQFYELDFNKEQILDKNEVLNELLEILQITFHYEETNIKKLDPTEKISLMTSIHQAQNETFSRKIESSAVNLPNISLDQQLSLKKLGSLLTESTSFNKNFGLSLKSPQSFSGSIRGNSVGHSGSTPRFRGESMIFKKKSYNNLNGDKIADSNGEFFFRGENTIATVDNRMQFLKKGKSLNMFGSPKNQIKKNNQINQLGELEEIYNESKEEEKSPFLEAN